MLRPHRPVRRLKNPLLYLGVTVAAVAAFLAIRARGEQIQLPPGASRLASPDLRASPDTLFHVLLALVAVIVVARLTGMLLRRFGQPPVIGEILAGIMLGPSLLGRVAPGAAGFLFPRDIVPLIGVVSQIGVVLYMFLVGLRLDLRLLRGKTRVSVAVSHASIVLPLVLGAALALWLYPQFSSSDVSFTAFALFIAVSMSITAFPVLARILDDRGMAATPLGAIALACAAVDDVTSWCLLAFLVGVVRSVPGEVMITIGLTAAFITGMLLAVRPVARLLATARDERGELTQGMFLIVCVGLLISAVATERIGIHALFGAFLWGALIPEDSALARDMAARLEDAVVVLLLPSFFAFTGMRTEIGLIGGEQLIACAVIIGVASLGKFGGTTIAAAATGLPRRQAMALGILMNTRGLVELIVLNVGLELGVISPALFTLLVIMAVVTTFATTPVLDRLRRGAAT
jgi:Kef-type K+ transport system membrane component KefB